MKIRATINSKQSKQQLIHSYFYTAMDRKLFITVRDTFTNPLSGAIGGALWLLDVWYNQVNIFLEGGVDTYHGQTKIKILYKQIVSMQLEKSNQTGDNTISTID